MPIVAELMDAAAADTDVLRTLASQGDNLIIYRDVDFLLIAPSAEKAEIIAGFINDYSYGIASVSEVDGQFRVLVLVAMPITQPVVLCISGFMLCVAHLFGASYDGWGCVAQRQT